MTEKITEELSKQMRDEFVHGDMVNNERTYPSIDALVNKHGVARATLYRIAERDNWQDDKNRIQTSIETQLDEVRVAKIVDQGKKLDDTALTLAQGLLSTVGRKLQQGLQAEQAGLKDSTLSENNLRELSQTAINAQKLGKLALGQAQEISKVSADVSSPEAFREVMEQLDQIAEARSSSHDHSLQ